MSSPRVPHWERLQAEVRRQLMAEVELAMKVAVLLQLGLPQRAIGERLGVTPADVRGAPLAALEPLSGRA